MEPDSVNISFRPPLIGRDEEISKLESLWKRTKEGKGSTVLVSGEAGVGKTRLVNELLKKAERENVTIIKGWCLADSLEPLMPFKEGFRDAGLSQILTEKPPPKVISMYLINKGGLLIAKAEREKTELDSDIFATMLDAVGNFVKDSLKMMGEDEKNKLNAIGYGEYDILVQTFEELSLAAVIKGAKDEILIEDMKRTLKKIGSRFDRWDGNMETAEKMIPDMKWFIDSKKYDGTHLVEDPKLKQENLFDRVLLGIKRVSEENIVILFLDDLQWGDPTSLNLLHYISRNTRNDRVFIVGTYRPEDITQFEDSKIHPLKTIIQNMGREELFHEMGLKRLNKSSVEDFINKTLKGVEVEKKYINDIYKESEGNPFFLLEVLKMLALEGHIVNIDNNWKPSKDLKDFEVPSKIYDIITRRLDRLMEKHRELLECASVVGEEFESRIVGEITGLNRIELLKSLNHIERTHNLIRSIKKRYMFDHSKIREVLYNSINEELRQEYHKIIAETYEDSKKDPDDLIYDLAKHWDKGGIPDKAFKYYKNGAEIAKKSFANELAIKCYDRLLELIPSLESSEVSYETVIDSLKQKGDCLKTMGEWSLAEESYKKALKIAEKKKDENKRAECTILIGDISKLEARYSEALDLYLEGSEIYKEVGNKMGFCESLGRIGSVYTNMAEYDKAMSYLDEMHQIADEIKDNRLLSKFYGNMGSTHYGRGEIKEAMKYFKKKLRIKEEEGDLLEIGYTLVNLASIFVRLKDYENSKKACNQALEIVEKTGDKLIEQNALGKLGIAYAEEGEYSKGLEYYKKKLSLSEKIGDKRSIAYVANNIGELYKEKGEYDKALRYYQKDVDISKDLADKRGYAITVGNMGNLYKLKNDFDKAKELYAKTIHIAREQDTKDVMSYFLFCEADLYFQKGLIERADALNKEALEIAEKIDMQQTIFSGNLLKAKILSEEDKEKGLRILKKMLKEDYNKPERAKLVYELYKISGEDNYKNDALEFYKKIYEKNPSIHYKQIIDELEH
ncbi:MAG: tetratricopeptide repeat protein [Thermoplasmatota archaeon]